MANLVEDAVEDVAGTAVSGVTSMFGGWWMYLIAGAVAIGIGAFGAWRVTSWADAGEIATLKGNVAIETASADSWKGAYDNLDKGMQKLRADGAKDTGDANVALAKLAPQITTDQTKEAVILKSTPKPGTDLCAAADALILGSLP